MKNLIKIISVLLILFISNYTQAQITCEIDSTASKMSIGAKILETSDGNLLMATIENLVSDRSTTDTAKFYVTKLDACGNIIWKTQIDSPISSYVNYNCLTELTDGTFLVSINFFPISNNSRSKVYKISNQGSLISTISLKNGFRVGYMMPINSNAYLFSGLFDNNDYHNILIYDSLGNIKKNNAIIVDSTTSNTITNVFMINENEIYLFVFGGGYNYTVKVDTLGNILNIRKDIARTCNSCQYFLSYDSNFIYGTTTAGIHTDSTLILKYNLDGNLIKSNLIPIYNPDNFYFFGISLKNNGLLLLSPNKLSAINKIIIILDSNLNVQRYDTFYSNSGSRPSSDPKLAYGRIYNQIILTKDSSIVAVGKHGRESVLNSAYNRWTSIRKQPLFYKIKIINIMGASTINQKNASIKLTLNILPANAYNKQVLWSINDTSLATITQAGLVTATANGTVIVTATAADGGGATATKTITITNQTVGINEVNLNNQITVYPNPASNKLTITTTNNITPNASELQLQLLDITGKVIAQYNNQTEIDLTAIANGMYLLHIQTPNGSVVKHVVVNR